MSAPADSRTARAPRDFAQDETNDPLGLAEPNAVASPRSERVEKRFAALEAQLARELQNSPSIIGGEDDGRPARPARRRPRSRRAEELEDLLLHLQRLAEDKPARPQAENARPAPHVPRGDDTPDPEYDSLPAHGPDHEHDEEVPHAEHAAARVPFGATARLQPETVPWIEPPERTSVFVRATRVAAVVFSVIAIAGVSALLVLLAVGDQWASTHVPQNTDRIQQTAALPAEPQASPAEEETTEVASIVTKRDASRIEPDAPAPAFGEESAQTADAPMGGPFVAGPEPQTVIGRTAPVSGASAPVENAPAASPSVPAWTPLEANGNVTPPAAVEDSAAAEMEVAPPETNVAAFGGDPVVPGAGEPAASAQPARTAAVTEHVNMRSGPRNEAEVVAIVPEGRRVEVVDCERWCEVVFDGKQGFIHSRFVQGTGG